jgi:L-serine deaminase
MSCPLSTAAHVHVQRAPCFGREVGQLEVVGGKQREAAVAVVQVAGDGAGQRQAVEGGGAAADLVHQHQAVFGGACTMAAASVISTMKVDCALARSSAAPMRVWMASIGPSRQARAGT